LKLLELVKVGMVELMAVEMPRIPGRGRKLPKKNMYKIKREKKEQN